MNKNSVNIIITGVGGQGNLSLARLIGETVCSCYEYVTIGETFGASQRGGSVESHLRVSVKEIYSPIIPNNQAHIIIGMEPIETVKALCKYGNPATKTIMEENKILPVGVISGELRYPDNNKIIDWCKDLSSCFYTTNFTQIARNMGNTKLTNSIIAGAFASLEIMDGFTAENFDLAVSKIFSQEIAKKNLEAFEKGCHIFQTH